MGEMGPSSGGIERAPRHVLVPREGDRDRQVAYPGGQYAGGWFGPGAPATQDEHVEDEQVTDWSSQLATIRRHWVTLACLGLIIVSLIWKAEFLAANFFRQDDFRVMDLARTSPLSWGFLTRVDAGHFFPGVWASAWVLSRVALYNWTAASAEVLVFTAAANLAAWRMLRTLMGNRPAVLIPLTLYVLSPLPFPNLTWWILSAEVIPLQIALFMSLTSHLHYVWTGRLRHAVAATCWLLFGLVFFEKSAVIPLVLFAVTAGFLVRRRRLLTAAKAAAVRYWKAWVLYFGLLFAYMIVFFASLSSSKTQPAAPSSMSALRTFSWNIVFKTFVPGVFGGPWHWLHFQFNGISAYAEPPTVLNWLALIVALVIIGGSILTRPRSWRGWAILVGWLVLADLTPVAVGRLMGSSYASLLGTAPRYVVDAAGLLVIVLALVFWPVAGPRTSTGQQAVPPRRSFFGGRWQTAAVALVTVFVVGSIWTVVQLTHTLDSASRTYIANATQALAQAPAGTVIIDQQVPPEIMIGLFGAPADTSVVLGPLSHRGAAVRWIPPPHGLVSGNLDVFGQDGRLYPAAISGITATPQPVCLTPAHGTRSVPLPPISPALKSRLGMIRISYEAGPGFSGAPVTVSYGYITDHFTLPPGIRNVYMPALGSAPVLRFHATVYSGSLCVFKVVAGYFAPLPGPVVPASPVSG